MILGNRSKAFPRYLFNKLKGKGKGICDNWLSYDLGVLHTPRIEEYIPPVLVLSITEDCDLRCPTCLYGLQSGERFKKSYMADSFFQKVVDANEGKSEILYISGGEPFLHPLIFWMADYGRQSGYTVKVSTNGLHIGKASLGNLRRFNEINVSVDSWDCDSFNLYRGGSKKQFNLLRESLDSLSSLSSPKFSMSFLLSKENVVNIEDMLNFAMQYGPNTVHFHNINPHGSVDYKYLFVGCNEEKYIRGITEKNDYPFDIVVSHIFDLSSKRFARARCVLPWYYLCVNSKGHLAPCCHIEYDGIKYGEYDDINNPGMVLFRERIMSGVIMSSCLYCHRRFLGDNYAVYRKEKGRWIKR